MLILTCFSSREGVDALKKQLEKLGATYVATYDDLSDKSFRGTVKEWSRGKVRPIVIHHFKAHLLPPIVAHLPSSELRLWPRNDIYGASPRV
jgi:hypothetical protein